MSSPFLRHVLRCREESPGLGPVPQRRERSTGQSCRSSRGPPGRWVEPKLRAVRFSEASPAAIWSCC